MRCSFPTPGTSVVLAPSCFAGWSRSPGNEGIRRVFGEILAENRAMQEICRQLGFDLRYSAEDGVVEASIALP